MTDPENTSNRRQWLKLLGSGTVVGLAGCSGGQEGEQTTEPQQTTMGGETQAGGESPSGGTTETTAAQAGGQQKVTTKYYHQWAGGRNQNDMGYTMTAEPGKVVGEFPCEFSPENAAWMKEHALMIARGADDLGLNGRIVSNPFSKLVDGWVNKGLNYPVVMIPQAPEPQRAADPHAFLGRKICGASNNFQNYCSSKMTKLVKKQLRTTDRQKRMKLVHQAQKWWARDEVQGWTFFPDILSPVNTNTFRGYFPMPGAGVSLDYYPWSFLTLQPKTDRTQFVKGTIRQMKRPNFMWGVSGVSSIWMTLVWDSLFDIGPNLNIVPGLATDAKFVDDTTVEVELRDGVTWHDGKSFGPEDVKFTTETFMDPVAANVAAYVQNLDKNTPIEILSNSGGGTVRYNLKSPDARFLTQGMVRNVMLPKHQWKKAQKPSEFRPEPPIGTGPLKWRNWEPGSQFELDAYKKNWMWSDSFQKEILGKYYTKGDGIDGLTWVNTGNIDSTIGAIKQGSIDAISARLSVSQAQRAAQAGNVKLVTADNFVGVNTSVDHTIPIIRDKEFRVAFMRHSWDVQSFVENVMQGFGKIPKSNNPIAESSPWYTDDTVPRKYDIDKARGLLRKAGYTWDDQGRLRYPTGKAWSAFVERAVKHPHKRRTELGQPDFS